MDCLKYDYWTVFKMNIFELLLIFLIFFLGFIFRSYLLMKYKWVGKDSFYHLIISQEIRKKKKIPDIINNFVIPEEYDYPPLLHVFLSLFHRKFHQCLQYISVFSDMLTGLVILLFCCIVFDIKVAIIATGFYFFTPITIDSSFSLGPRSIANLFMTISLLFLGYYYETGLGITIYIVTICSLFVLLTHRLTTQSLMFSLIVLSFGVQSIIPLHIITASFIMAIIITDGYYLTVVRGHINFIKIFATKIFHKEDRKEMSSIFPNPLYLLFNIPIFVLFLISLSMLESPIIKFLSIVGLSLTILSFIWVFGEGIRHMNNAIFAFAILSALYISKFSNIIIIIIFIPLLLFSTYKLFRMEKMLKLGNVTTTDMLEGFEFIKSHKKEGDILLCLPLDFTYNAAYFTDCTMLQSSGGFAKGLNFNQKLNQLLKDNTSKLINEYNVNWVFLMISDVIITNGKTVFQSGSVTVIKVEN